MISAFNHNALSLHPSCRGAHGIKPDLIGTVLWLGFSANREMAALTYLPSTTCLRELCSPVSLSTGIA